MTANEFHLEHGICVLPYCDNWATHYLLGTPGKPAREQKVCESCADALIVRFSDPKDLHWSKKAIAGEVV